MAATGWWALIVFLGAEIAIMFWALIPWLS